MERMLDPRRCEECMYTNDLERYSRCPVGYDQLHPDCPWYEDALWEASQDPLSGPEWVDRAVTAERELDKIRIVLGKVAKDLDEPFYGDGQLDITQRLLRFGADAVAVMKEAKTCKQM